MGRMGRGIAQRRGGSEQHSTQLSVSLLCPLLVLLVPSCPAGTLRQSPYKKGTSSPSNTRGGALVWKQSGELCKGTFC